VYNSPRNARVVPQERPRRRQVSTASALNNETFSRNGSSI